MPVVSKNKETVQLFFIRDSEKDTSSWKCKCGKTLIQKPGTGWSNLLCHLKSQHPDFASSTTQPTLNNFVVSSSSSAKNCKLQNVSSWIEWVSLGLKPFSFVDDELTHKYTNLKPISSKTLKKYMQLLTKEVESIIRNKLPQHFALLLDGWSHNSTHFVAVFASYTDDSSENGYSAVLLAFSPFHEETEFTAKAHHDFLTWMLVEVYHKSFDNVVALIGDNCSVNKALANLCELPLLGCSSHRLNLAVTNFLLEYENRLSKLNSLMGKLKSLKLSGKLRKYTELRPVQRNVTRWSSTYEMVTRYFKLKEFLSLGEFDKSPELLDYMLTARENSDLMELSKDLAKFDSVTKALQRESTSVVEMRILFDEISKLYPRMEKYLSPGADIVHSPSFESGILKISNEQEDFLDPDERQALTKLELSRQSDSAESQSCNDDTANSKLDFAGSLLKRRKLNCTTESEKIKRYPTSIQYLLPTSNVLERFFSVAGIAYNDLRQSLLPVNLEMQLFLKVNKSLWNIDTLETASSNADF